MKKRTIATILIVMFMLSGFTGCTNNIYKTGISASVWREVPLKDGKSVGLADSLEFDLKKTIMDTDYVFSGTVVGRKEYEIEWTDDKREQWGPFQKSVIEVKINKEYYGNSPVKDDILKVYYPYALSMVFDDSFLIKDESEYIFITQALDEKFIEYRAKNSPQDKFEQEKYADVYISDPCYSIMPIDNGTVFMYRDYFCWDVEIMKQTKVWDSVDTDKISSAEFLKTGWFMALDIKDFESAFLNLFESPEKLPGVDDLMKLREMDTSKNPENIE